MKQETQISAQEFFTMFEALLQERRSGIKNRCRVAFAVVDEGPFLLDTHQRKMITRAWRTDCDVSVLCNKRTLNDIVRGRFDMTDPSPEHLFLWGGDRETWRVLERVFRDGKTVFGTRLAALKSRKKGGRRG